MAGETIFYQPCSQIPFKDGVASGAWPSTSSLPPAQASSLYLSALHSAVNVVVHSASLPHPSLGDHRGVYVCLMQQSCPASQSRIISLSLSNRRAFAPASPMPSKGSRLCFFLNWLFYTCQISSLSLGFHAPPPGFHAGTMLNLTL